MTANDIPIFRPLTVIVSDDGRRAEGRDARFLLLDPGQLQIAP